MVREVLRERFLDTLKELGGSAGNGRLRDTLGWQPDTYWSVHAALTEDGTVIAGRGRGGSVALRRTAAKASARRVAKASEKAVRKPEALRSSNHTAYAKHPRGKIKSYPMLAFDWRETPDQDQNLENDLLFTVGFVNLALDLFGRVQEIDIDELDGAVVDFRERLDDVFEYGPIADGARAQLPSRILMWRLRVDHAEDGGLVAEASLPVREGLSEHIIGRAPPANVRGRKLRQWREDHGEWPSGPMEANFATLVESAQWMAQRAVRGDPLLQIGNDWRDISLLETTKELLGDSASEGFRPVACDQHGAEPATLLRATFAPRIDEPEAIQGPETQLWPEIELDLLLQADGFPVQIREHFGRWSLTASKGGVLTGLATLTPDGLLDLRGFPGGDISWPTNLMARLPLANDDWCLWQPNWQSSCGYHRVSSSAANRVTLEQ